MSKCEKKTHKWGWKPAKKDWRWEKRDDWKHDCKPPKRHC